MEELRVVVQEDHVKTLTSASPIKAIEELIYNALDADATVIEVLFETNEMEGLRSITVKDNGTGIHEDNKKYLKGLGGSWKKHTSKTPVKKRIVHGKYGTGRFKAFALGSIVTWHTCFEKKHKKYQWSISGNSSQDIRTFQVSNITESSSPTGTRVIVENVEENTKKLPSQKAIDTISSDLAIYLTNYNGIIIKYDGKKIDPSACIIDIKEYKKSITIDGNSVDISISIYEWKTSVDKALYLCTENGFVLEKRPLNTATLGYNLSIYIKSKLLEEKYENEKFLPGDFDDTLKKITEIGRLCAKEYCREKIILDGNAHISSWKQENIYPYEGEASNEIENAERQLFEVVALSINEHLPRFNSSDTLSKKLSFSLVKEALENSPSALSRILEKVINLPKNKIEDLNSLLVHTTLADIISASKVVADRIQFLTGLESLIYDYEKHLKERSQLHKLLEKNTWIFGEEYHMTVSDKSLNTVLKTHLNELRPDDNTPVLTPDGKQGIIDLMLSRGIPESNPEQKNHLVIELKRPSQSINMKVFGQISSYASVVTKDSRFARVPAKWSFWAISNEIHSDVSSLTDQENRPEGLAFDSNGVQVWLFPWSKIINKCKARLLFYQDQLKFETDANDALKHLQQVYSQFLPDEAKGNN